MKITSTKEDYLRALYRLEEEGEASVQASALAKSLRLSKSTISERLREMARMKLVRHEHYGTVQLTPKGRSLARTLTYKHRIIEVFLTQTLRMPKAQVHAEAHALEHAVSDMVIKKLAAFLGHPTVDPHGTVIPKL